MTQSTLTRKPHSERIELLEKIFRESPNRTKRLRAAVALQRTAPSDYYLFWKVEGRDWETEDPKVGWANVQALIDRKAEFFFQWRV